MSRSNTRLQVTAVEAALQGERNTYEALSLRGQIEAHSHPVRERPQRAADSLKPVRRLIRASKSRARRPKLSDRDVLRSFFDDEMACCLSRVEHNNECDDVRNRKIDTWQSWQRTRTWRVAGERSEYSCCDQRDNCGAWFDRC